MARVPRRAASAQAPLARSRAAKAKSRKHKIVMESVTQAKKKLRSVISFEAKAPPGYTFIPAGNPQLTNACKETCRKEGHKIFAVSTTPHQRMHNLSQQVHRIGYHFPSVVVAASCMELGVLLSSTGKVMTYEEAHPRDGPAHFGHKLRADSVVSQTTINTEARDAIRDLFPNIPDSDLNQIIKTAFQKGQKKVGTASELPLARRAQLAVVAHIRHVYTQYDRLLRETSFQDARAVVEQPTLAKLVQWRGDDENGKTVLEDVFREVIVISDDEDDDSDMDEDINATGTHRESSIEVVSSNALVGELETRPVHYSNLETTNNSTTRDDEAPSGFRFVPEAHRRDPARRKNPDRRGFNRYQAWDRARDRYRGGHGAEYANIPRHPIDEPIPRKIPEFDAEPRPDRVQEARGHQFNERPRDFQTRPVDRNYESRVPLERVRRDDVHTNGHNTLHPPQPRPLNGRRTEPIEAPNRVTYAPAPGPGYERIAAPQSSHKTYIPVPRDAPAGENVPQVRSNALANSAYRPDGNPDANRVYPSIEAQSPPSRVRVNRLSKRDYQTLDEYPRHPQTPRAIDEISRQVNVIGIDDDRDHTLYKRRRVQYNTPLRENVSRENRVNEARPVAAPTLSKPMEPQYISLISPQSGRGSDRMHPRIRDENTGPLHELAPVVGRQLEKHPVGRAPSLIPVHHNPSFPGVSDHEGGHNYRAPISLHSRHDPDASVNSFKPPPPPISLTRDSRYMARDNGHAVRSNQVSNMVEPRPQYVDRAVRQASEVPRVPREEARPLAMRGDGPVRHRYISDQGRQVGGERPHEFARPHQLQDRENTSYYDMPQPAPPDRQSGYIPSHRMERDPYAGELSERPVPGTHMYRYPSAQHSYPNNQVPVSGQHRLVRIGPGSVPQDMDTYMIHSPTSAARLRDTRGRPSLDSGRYIRDGRSISPRRIDRSERMQDRMHVRLSGDAYTSRPFRSRDEAILVGD